MAWCFRQPGNVDSDGLYFFVAGNRGRAPLSDNDQIHMGNGELATSPTPDTPQAPAYTAAPL